MHASEHVNETNGNREKGNVAKIYCKKKKKLNSAYLLREDLLKEHWKHF